MHVNLHKRFLVTLLIMLILIPFSVHAQGKVSLDAVNVQLWPEFDQPDMLVIMNIQIAPYLAGRIPARAVR